MTSTSLLSTMMKSKPLRFALSFILKTEEGGRARHPFGFLLIHLLLCLMVFLPGGMTPRSKLDDRHLVIGDFCSSFFVHHFRCEPSQDSHYCFVQTETLRRPRKRRLFLEQEQRWLLRVPLLQTVALLSEGSSRTHLLLDTVAVEADAITPTQLKLHHLQKAPQASSSLSGHCHQQDQC